MTWGGEVGGEEQPGATAEGVEGAEGGEGGEDGEGEGAAHAEEYEHGAVDGGDKQRDEPCEKEEVGRLEEEEEEVPPSRPNPFGAFAFAGGATSSSSSSSSSTLARRRGV